MNLYEINAELEKLVEYAIDAETGEVNEGALEELEALSIARDEKIENIALCIKNLNADADAIKAEVQALQKRARTAKNKADWLKDYLQGFLNGQKFSTAKVAISYRKSTSVECEDINLVNDIRFLRYSEPELKKTEAKEFIKKGGHIEGVALVEKVSMQIK